MRDVPSGASLLHEAVGGGREDAWCASVKMAPRTGDWARPEDGSGLRGLGDRVEALGGWLTPASTRGPGTAMRTRLPVAGENAAGLVQRPPMNAAGHPRPP